MQLRRRNNRQKDLPDLQFGLEKHKWSYCFHIFLKVVIVLVHCYSFLFIKFISMQFVVLINILNLLYSMVLNLIIKSDSFNVVYKQTI